LLENMSRIAPVLVDDIADSKTIATLTTRERQVLVLVANGYSRREIGETLCISFNTAASHIRNIYAKLEISTTAEATRIALDAGLIK